MFLMKLRNLALSQRFWTLVVGLASLLSSELLGFEVDDETTLVAAAVMFATFIATLAWREPNVN